MLSGGLEMPEFPQYKFEDLKDVYESFTHPSIYVEMGERDVAKSGLAVIGAEISVSAGFEAGVCTLEVANVFDTIDSAFTYSTIIDVFCLGKFGTVAIGYGLVHRTVFKGFVSQMRFSYKEKETPICIVTLMDIKGIMMSTRFNQQIEAKDYTEAVKEVFNKANLVQMTEIYSLNIDDVNKVDVPTGLPGEIPTDIPSVPEPPSVPGLGDASAFTVEMVDESDYEFVVRAAKRYNFEFFCVGDEVIFRKARSGANLIMTVGPELLISDFNIEYNISGIVRNIEVRGVDPDKGTVIIGKRKLSKAISNGSKADFLLKSSKYILHDATISSDKDAEKRLDYLENEISNRFGRLVIEHIGIPEMTPGRFIKIEKLTSKFSKKFYLTNVTHIFDAEDGYKTRLEGVAPTVSGWS